MECVAIRVWKGGRAVRGSAAAKRTFLSGYTADGLIMRVSPAFRVVDGRVSTVLRQKLAAETRINFYSVAFPFPLGLRRGERLPPSLQLPLIRKQDGGWIRGEPCKSQVKTGPKPLSD